MQTSHNISGVTGSKFIKFVAVVMFFIDGVKLNNPRCDPSTRCRMTGTTF